VIHCDAVIYLVPTLVLLQRHQGVMFCVITLSPGPATVREALPDDSDGLSLAQLRCCDTVLVLTIV